MTLYFDFRQSMIVICDRFCSPEVVINGSCGSYESFLVWGKPFRTVGEEGRGACGLCSKLMAHPPAWPSEAALAAFAVLRGLLMVSVGAMRPIWSGDGPFWTVGVGGGGEFVGCVQVEKSVRARVAFRC